MQNKGYPKVDRIQKNGFSNERNRLQKWAVIEMSGLLAHTPLLSQGRKCKFFSCNLTLFKDESQIGTNAFNI